MQGSKEGSRFSLKNSNIFYVITFLVLFLIIILSFAYVFFLAAKEKQIIETRVYEVASQAAIAIKNEIDSDIETLELLGGIIEANPKLLNIHDIMVMFEDEIDANKFLTLGIITPDGRYYSVDDKKHWIKRKLTNNMAFNEALQGKIMVYSPKTDKKMFSGKITYMVPIIIKNKVKGVLVTTHDAKSFINALNTISFNHNAFTHIIKSDGTFVVKTEKNLVQQKENLWEKKVTILSDVRTDENRTIWLLDPKKILKVASFAPIGVRDWQAVTIVPISAFAGNMVNFLWLTVSIFLIINVVIIMIFRHTLASRKKTTRLIERIAFFDDVTDCYNRTKFFLEVKRELKKSTDKKRAIILISVKKFKLLCQIYSQKVGNEFLKAVKDMLVKYSPRDSIYAKGMNDDFVVFASYRDIVEIDLFIKNMTMAIKKYPLDFNLDTVFGIYEITDTNMPINSMYDKASIAKLSLDNIVGENSMFFDKDLIETMKQENEVEKEMEFALKNNQFKMYLQPKYDLKTLKPCGAEALVRWQHPQNGLIPPFKFIPLFERNGFITKVDQYIWETAIKTIRRWMDEGITPVPISVNVSRLHLNNPHFINKISNLAELYDVPKAYIELELTESVFLENDVQMKELVIKLQNLGFAVSMDDFGSGYSSLNMLKQLPVNILKLDRGFINEASCSERGYIVLKNVVKMAKELKTTIVCEGIETEEQAELLRNLDCDIAQGFLYAKPMPINEFEKKIFDRIVTKVI